MLSEKGARLLQLLPIAEFTYNNASHSTTQVSPFFINKGFYPRFDITILEISVSSLIARQYTNNLQELYTYLRDQITITNEQSVKQFNKSHLPSPPYEIGDLVWLNAKNIKTQRPSKKLDHKRLGPFKILQVISKNVLRLDLPSSMQIHPIFNISLLDPYTPNTIEGRHQPDPAPIIVDNTEKWEVDKILDSKINKRYIDSLRYLVQWKGFRGTISTSWEPSSNLTHCEALRLQFHKAYPSKPSTIKN